MARKVIRTKTKRETYNLPVVLEKDEDGFYIAECPLFEGCYTQGKTLDEAMKNIEEVIDLVLEEKENRQLVKNYRPESIGLHTVRVNLSA